MYAIVSHGYPAPRLHFRAPRMEVLLGVFGAVVALDVALVSLYPPVGPLDHLSSITWSAQGTTLSSAPGFTARPNPEILLTLQDTNCFLGCTDISFTAVTVSPTSFAVLNANLPVIPPGYTGNLTVLLRTPPGAYTGPVALELA